MKPLQKMGMHKNQCVQGRRSIRLKGYDYSQPGAYFVTICTKNQACIFGRVVDGGMVLNDLGRIARSCWEDVPNHFQQVVSDAFIVMPNHVHGILFIMDDHVGATHASPLLRRRPCGPHPGSLGAVVGSYKSAVTRWCHQNGYLHFRWQRNYYEHIVRSENELGRIREYVVDNPLKWDLDDENPDRIRSKDV